MTYLLEGGDLPVPDLQTMEELCQPTLNGRGRPIAPIAIQATNFRLKNDMIQQVQKSCQFHGLSGDDGNKHLDKFLHVTQSIKVNGVTDDAIRLHRDTINAAAGGTFMKRRPEECYDLIENMTAHHNDWVTFVQQTIVGQTQNVYAAGAYNQGGNSYQPQGNRNLLSYRSDNYLRPPGFNQNQNRSNRNQNYQNQNRNQGNNHGIPQGNNQGRNQFFQGASHASQARAYQAPGYQALVHQASIPQPQVVTTTEFTNYMKANDAILKNMQTNMTSLINSNLKLKNMFGQFMKMNTTSSLGLGTLPSNTITNPKEDLKGITTRSGITYKGPTIPTTSSSLPKVMERETEPNPKPSIPYPSRLHNQKLRDKTNDQREKFFKIFQDLDFNISFADALILMPKFGLTIKSLLTNKDNLFELAKTPLNEHFSVVLLKKLPEKLGDPRKFLIPCDFPGMDECLALADLGTSINLMPLSVWNKLSLLELCLTCMTLKLADRSISLTVRSGHALIDVYKGELTLRVGNKAIIFNLDQTSRYFTNYDAMLVNRIDLIDVACEEYSQEVLGFSVSGDPTPSTEPIVSTSSPTLTRFGDSDFLLEETDAFLAINDEPISPEIDEAYYDSKGDILLLEEFLNDDPSSPSLPLQELKVVEPTNEKSSIDEPPVVELKDLPPHLEYAFLECDDKLPFIIAKDLKDEE
nr:hypothetical protein [Tanacetum cinerariifolium]